MRRLRVLLLIAPVLSTGCVGTVSSVCPAPVEYSPAFQERLAAEVEALPPGAALETAMIDYGRTRDMLRACRGG